MADLPNIGPRPLRHIRRNTTLTRLLPLVFILSFHAIAAGQDTAPAAMPAQQAAAEMKLPDGFGATVFAAEPDVVQPIAMTIDTRGRLWVVECTSYPDWQDIGVDEGKDRVLIFEDTDGDGRHDRRTVFLDNGRNLSGIEVGFGGVYLCSSPDLIFIPDADGDDVPDGPAETLLSGFSLKMKHNVFNGLHWGPDGWLYGMHGILDVSQVTNPSKPDQPPVPMTCGVWRFHPTQKVFEPYSAGSTNPWGIDWNSVGQAFFTNCVIEHVFHAIPGARFKRMFGNDLNPYTFTLMDSCADHIHWAGGYWNVSIGGKHDDAGGGHAHCGAMIYQGDNWPEKYRDKLYTINIHGRRMNCDRLVASPDGYVASHDADFMQSVDPFFRGVEMKYGPDGTVYVLDWNDTGECHDFVDIHVETGRIFKIAYGTPRQWSGDLNELPDDQLLELQNHENAWFMQTARRVLQHRVATQPDNKQLASKIVQAYRDVPLENSRLKLRMLWLTAACGLAHPAILQEAARGDINLQAWATRLAGEDASIAAGTIQTANQSAGLLLQEQVAAAIRRDDVSIENITPELVANIADEKLRKRLLQLMWYAIEPRFNAKTLQQDPAAIQSLSQQYAAFEPPILAHCISQKLAAIDAHDLVLTVAASAQCPPASRESLISGLLEALRGRSIDAPQAWSEARDSLLDGSIQGNRLGYELALIFGDASARKQLAGALTGEAEDAQNAFDLLVQYSDADTAVVVQQGLKLESLRTQALRALGNVELPDTAAELIADFGNLPADQQTALIDAMVTRNSYAKRLLSAIENKQVPETVLTTFAVGQLSRLKDKAVQDQLRKIYGTVTATDATRNRQIDQMKRMLTEDAIAGADLHAGKQVFVQKCATCHKLLNEGGTIGPDLTGGQRKSVEYFLENVISPNTLVPMAYKMSTIETIDGRVLAGVIESQDDQRVVLQTPKEKITLAKDDIEEITATGVSLMPEGLLDDLTHQQIIDLSAYFQSDFTPVQ